jgi:hypothetical protein
MRLSNPPDGRPHAGALLLHRHVRDTSDVQALKEINERALGKVKDALPVPDPTDTPKPIARSRVVGGIVEALAYRKIEVVRDEYGISQDGMLIFGFLELDIERAGIRLGIAVRNANDKAFALVLVAGYRTFVCDNLAFRGDFMAVTRKHSKTLEKELQDVLALGVDRVQRQFADARPGQRLAKSPAPRHRGQGSHLRRVRSGED